MESENLLLRRKSVIGPSSMALTNLLVSNSICQPEVPTNRSRKNPIVYLWPESRKDWALVLNSRYDAVAVRDVHLSSDRAAALQYAIGRRFSQAACANGRALGGCLPHDLY